MDVSANVRSDATVQQLDRPAQPDENIVEQDVREPRRLLRWLLTLFRRVAGLERRWAPRRLDFEGLASTGTNIAPQDFQLAHNFNGEVRWWVVDAQSTYSVTLPLVLRVNANDPNVLTVRFYYSGTFTVRVEEAG